MLKKTFFLLCFAIVLFIVNSDAYSQVSITYIKRNFSDIINTEQEVVGYAYYKTGTERTEGFYTLKSIGLEEAEINVYSSNLPSPGKYRIKARVSVNPNNQEPILMELKRGPIEGIANWKLIATAGVFGILVIVLIYILIGTKKKVKYATPYGAPEPKLEKAEAPADEQFETPVYEGGTPEFIGYFEVIDGIDKGKRFDITSNTHSIGRQNTDILLSAQAVSRLHALIEYDPNTRTMTLIHKSHTNQTKVNNVIVHDRQILKDGDEVFMSGEKLILHFTR